jgi:hypothetical protein
MIAWERCSPIHESLKDDNILCDQLRCDGADLSISTAEKEPAGSRRVGSPLPRRLPGSFSAGLSPRRSIFAEIGTLFVSQLCSCLHIIRGNSYSRDDLLLFSPLYLCENSRHLNCSPGTIIQCFTFKGTVAGDF